MNHERKVICVCDSGGCASSHFQSVPKIEDPQHNYRFLASTGRPNEYQLVDEKGITNQVYSATVHLDSYVGQSVTLTGDQSATPSTDNGMGRPTPHFKVVKVQPTSGDCKK